jgi:hypothetical protein
LPVPRSDDLTLAVRATDSGSVAVYFQGVIGKTRAFEWIRAAATIAVLGAALLAMPAAASADRTIHLQREGQTITVVVGGHPRASDLEAIKTAHYPAPTTGGAGASTAAHTQFCGRSVLANQSCGNVPTDFSYSNGVEYRGKGTVRVCALISLANHFYPNGDPRYPWVGQCGNNVAAISTPGWMYTYPNDGWWTNNAVVNASPWTHTIWQDIGFLPFSAAGVCGFDVQC